jgi:hypothetical protein
MTRAGKFNIPARPRFVFSVFILSVWFHFAHAQTYSGGLRGANANRSGAVIAGASISLTNDATQETRSTQSDGAQR